MGIWTYANTHSVSRALRFCAGLLFCISLSGCLLDDPPPCTIKDDLDPDPTCLVDPNISSFKVEYTTANGTRPDGRFTCSPSSTSSAQAEETECRAVLQGVFNTSSAYVAIEAQEVRYFRGNICGDGYRLKTGLREIRVVRTRKIAPNKFDYDLELTCTL